MREQLKPAARVIANTLPVIRAYDGHVVAERLRTDMRDPTERTWQFAGRVAAVASTDGIDGLFARIAGPTRFGGWLDQICDKAWFLQITRQLVKNGELDGYNFWIPAIRDAGTLAIRPVAEHYGLSADAVASGKQKMQVQVAATLASCSPLAATHPEFVSCLYSAASALSITSGLEMAKSYATDIAKQYPDEPIAQVIAFPALHVAANMREAA